MSSRTTPACWARVTIASTFGLIFALSARMRGSPKKRSPTASSTPRSRTCIVTAASFSG
jgi:hypothetical protein